jgi:hypothetical protein
VKDMMIGGQTVKVDTKLLIVMKNKLRIILCQIFYGLRSIDLKE